VFQKNGSAQFLRGGDNMRYRIAVEDMEPNHWIAWALDLPACFSSAQTQISAIDQSPMRIAEYFSWLSNNDRSLPLINEPVEVEVVETFHSSTSDEDYEYLINAFFADDRRPLTYWDTEAVLRLLQWTSQDLSNLIQPITQDRLSKQIAGELRGSIAGLLKHIAGAENWYFDQLDLGLTQDQLPDDPLDMLKTVRANTRSSLVKLIADKSISKNRGELWSARKVVRRTLWHERDHTQHIAQLLAQL
jgi:uncharacterized damage-inducible protein DinB